MFPLSACVWSLRQPPRDAVARARLAGFDYVDLRSDCWSGIADRADAAPMSAVTAARDFVVEWGRSRI